MRVMLDIVIYRYAFPDWCEVDVDPEDLQAEYEQVRKLHQVLYLNLTLQKTFHEYLQNRVAQEID